MPPEHDVTALLKSHEAGDSSALQRLFPLVYDELRGLAQRVFARQHAAATLQPTVLVHEAFLKLCGGMRGVTGRHHFFAVAARAMRQVLADHARALARGKRQHAREVVTLSGLRGQGEEGFDLLVIHDLLERLALLNPRHAEVVELRVLGGLTVPEVADVLGVSSATVDKDWAVARAWLAQELLGL